MGNPVFILELLIRIRERKLWALLAFFLVALGLLCSMVFTSFSSMSNYMESGTAEVAGGLIWFSIYLQSGLLIIFAPLSAAGRFSQEREQRTLSALLNTPYPRWKMVMGKLLAAWAMVLWLWSLPLPVLYVGALWGGPPLPRIVLAVLSNLVLGCVLASVAIGFSAYFGRTLSSYLACGAFLFAWIALTPLLGTQLVSGRNAGENDGSDVEESVAAYACFYHHPFYPLISMTDSYRLESEYPVTPRLAFCYAVWSVFLLTGFYMGVRGLRREQLS